MAVMLLPGSQEGTPRAAHVNSVTMVAEPFVVEEQYSSMIRDMPVDVAIGARSDTSQCPET
jgi:hypothetical protein